MTVADHQPVTILIDLLGMGVDIGRQLRLQGGDASICLAASRTISSSTEPLASLGSASSWTTLSMGVPSRPARQRRHMIRLAMGYRSSSGRGAPSRHPAEDHPQVLIIARDRRLGGIKFRRRHAVGPFILDFYTSLSKLVVELDGSIHDGEEQASYDQARTAQLLRYGYRVLRFRNDEVLQDLPSVLNWILSAVRMPED